MKIIYQYFLFVNVLSLQDDDVKPMFVSKVKKGKWFIKVEKNARTFVFRFSNNAFTEYILCNCFSAKYNTS